MSARSHICLRVAIVGVQAALLLPGPGRAWSLNDSLLLAYQTNPTLRAQRLQVQATDEGLVQARAGYGPSVNLTAQADENVSRVQNGASLFSGPTDVTNRALNGSGDFSIVQPLYTSGAVHAQVRAAGADILGAREALRETETEVLLDVITAYADVLRDRENLQIIGDEIDHLQRDFNETKAKSDFGQLTRTDVGEAEARLMAARASLPVASGRLRASEAEYLNVVGEPAERLDPLQDLPGLPKTLEESFAASEQNNPQIRQSIEAKRSAHAKFNEATAALGPKVSFRIDVQAQPNFPYVPDQYNRGVMGSLVVNQPIFSSGLLRSRIREAADRDRQAVLNIDVTRRAVLEHVTQAWAQLTATQTALVLTADQVRADTLAVEGNEAEERAGSRSTFELVSAELELATSREGLAQLRHDCFVAQATLLADMGLLQMSVLVPSAQLSDPRRNLDRVSRIGAVPWEGLIARIDGLPTPGAKDPSIGGQKSGAPDSNLLAPSTKGAKP